MNDLRYLLPYEKRVVKTQKKYLSYRRRHGLSSYVCHNVKKEYDPFVDTLQPVPLCETVDDMLMPLKDGHPIEDFPGYRCLHCEEILIQSKDVK
jgi:hypothetical protein